MQFVEFIYTLTVVIRGNMPTSKSTLKIVPVNYGRLLMQMSISYKGRPPMRSMALET